MDLRKSILHKSVLYKTLPLLWIVPFLALPNLTSCSKVLSHRTDEQAWIEFDKEARSNRIPAAFTDTQSPSLSFLHENLSAIPVRSMLLKCGDAVNARICYQSAMTLQFDEVFRTAQAKFSELRLTDYKREQKAFFDFRSYEIVLDEVNRFHQSILSGLDLKARVHAADLFKGCDGDEKKDTAIENFNVLTSLTFEMPKGVYACLSDHWISDENQLLDETSDRLGLSIVTSEAKKWIKTQQISPIYEAEINTVVGKKAQEELDQFTHEKTEVLAGFDPKQSQDTLVKEWSVKLREKYPYSPVEQWVVNYVKTLSH